MRSRSLQSDSSDPFSHEEPVASEMLLEDGEYESFSPWSNPGMYTEDLESETEDEAAKAGRDDAYEEEEGLVDEGPSAEATQEVTDRYEFGDEREFEAEDAERAALADPEFGGQFEGEVDASRIEPGYADRWSELELPASVFPQPEEEEESPSGLEPGLSPLAQRGRLHPGKGARTPPWSEHVYGLVVHTTGGTLPGKARKAGVPPDEYAARYYLSSGGTHYVNGWAGADGQQLHQVMNERQQAWGVGRWKDQPATDQWRSIDSGRFELDLPPTVLRLWRARWPGFKDSLSLLPVRSSANLTYVHVECVPCVYYRNGDGPLITDPGATPMRDGLRFTRAQHETVARLALDIAQRHQWRRQETWWRTPRLLGHEDITPLSRHDKNGGWDPGGLRERPYFDWNFVSDYLGRLRDGTARPPSASSTTDAAVPTSVGGLLGALADRFRRLVQAGQEVLAITEAVRNGQTDVNQLANLVFFARHPELNGRPIRPEERQLAQEWLEIRDAVVRPVVARLAVARPARRPITAAPPKAPSVGGPAVSGRGPSAGKIYFGLDTASVAGNKDPDWRQAKSEVPIDFAIIRSNYGVRQDAVFTRDWPKIKSAGIVRGAYLFLRFPHNKRGPAPDPVAQAEALVKTVGNLDESDLPPTLDVEFPGSWRETKMTQRQLLAGVRDAWKVLKNHYGVAPIIYTSARVWRDDLGNPPAPDLVESPLWLARYPFKRGPAVHDAKAFVGGKHDPPVPPPWGDATNWWIHQYQGDAVGLPSFPTGNIDMNRFNTMVKGATGDRVKWAQRRLGISQTGQFDAELETALRAFQEKRGLPVDSVIDPRAFAYLCWSNP